MEMGTKGHPVPAWDGGLGRGTLNWGSGPSSFWGRLTRLSMLPPIRGGGIMLCSLWPRLWSSIRPSMPRITLIPGAAQGHNGVWGP